MPLALVNFEMILRKISFRTRSLILTHGANLISSLGSGMVITGIWPYLKAVSCKESSYLLRYNNNTIVNKTMNRVLQLQLDPTVTMSQYGFVVASDALAQILFSLLYGYLVDKIGCIRHLSLWCGFIYTLGNLSYANVSLIPRSTNIMPQPRFYAMIISRLMVGAGTGTFLSNLL